MASSTENRPAEPNHDSQIYAVVACFSALSFIALTLRLMSKRMKGVKFYYDDYLAIISWVHMSLSKIVSIRLTYVQVLTLAEGVMIASGQLSLHILRKEGFTNLRNLRDSYCRPWPTCFVTQGGASYIFLESIYF